MKNQQIWGEETFEVRDLREKEHFIVDDLFLNGFAKVLGVTTSMVYITLCRHVDKEQKCFPSQKMIAKKLSLSEPTVIESVKVLELFRMIRKKRIGKQCTNRYWLLSKKQWRNDFEVILNYLSSPDIKLLNNTTKVTLVHNLSYLSSNRKETQKKGNTKERIIPSLSFFEDFWNSYPSKEGKKNAEEIWRDKKLDMKKEEILLFVEKAKETDRWRRGFIKSPVSFLKGEHWTDDLSSYGDSQENSGKMDVFPEYGSK